MPDRRQGDRRENSSVLNKKISISLSTFIAIVTIVAVILASVVLCRVFFLRGYENGYSDGYSDALIDTNYVFEDDNALYDESADIVE